MNELDRFDPFGDPFAHMKQIMKGFGGFENDPFFNRPMGLGHFEDPT